MNLLLEDISIGAANGIESVDAFGERCVIFLDPVALIADWPALAVLTDAMGHSADVFCSFCVFPKSKGSASATIAYTSKLHSRRMSLMRFDARMDIVRNTGIIPEKLRKQLGLKSNTRHKASAFFTERLSAQLYHRNQQSLPKMDTGERANEFHFDSFLSAPAAPDHLLTGLIKDVLRLCFTELGCNISRRRMCRAISTYISTHNLPRIDAVIRYTSDGLIQQERGIILLDNNLTMTNMFCVLLFASKLFNQKYYTMNASAYATNDIRPFHLPALLQDVVSMVYWLPTTKSSTKKDFHYVRNSPEYHGDLLALASKYVDEIGEYIANGGRHGSILDKPNVHRLLELCANSIPIFQHATNISELVLESIHQNFKGWLERNSNHNSHITAFDNAIAKDWAIRLYALFNYFMYGTDHEKESAYFGLLRLLLGEDVAITYRTSIDPHPALKQLLSDFRTRIPSLFKPPIPFMLKGKSSNPMVPISKKYWAPGKTLSNSDLTDDVRHGARHLFQLYAGVRPTNPHDVKYYCSATLMLLNKCTGHRREYSYNTLRTGSLFSVVTNDSDSHCVAYAQTSDSQIVYFCVIAFASMDERSIWSVSRRMETTDGLFFGCSSRVQLVHLCSSVRPVAAIHKCDEECKISPDGHFKHSHNILEGGQWEIIGARKGYPPHMG